MLSKKKNLTITLAAFLLAAFFVAPKIVFGQVIINEVAWMGTKASSSDEWIELYNNSNEPISIEGWSLNESENKLIITLKNSIAANSYYLIERTNDLVTSIPADLFGSWGGNGLSNDGEKISLKDSDGNIIDEIDCSLKWFVGKASPDYQTMERTNPDLSSMATNWHSNSGNNTSIDAKGNLIQGTPKAINSVISTPIPSAAPSSSPATTISVTPSPSAVAQTFDYSQDILINEFLPAPNDGEKEWIELYNAGSSVINLAGWQIDDADNSTSPQVIPENTTIYANGFLVVSFNKSTLNNDGDKVRLLWPDNQVVHAVSYDKAKPGQSVAKFNNSWLWTNQPTPGQANKKSATENSEPVVIVANAEKINPIEESVSTPVNPSPNKKTPTPQTVISSIPSSSAIDQPINNLENINLSAAIKEPVSSSLDEPLKENYKISSLLSLTGVVLLAGLAASTLIYFRRRKAVDSQNPDD